MTASCSNAVRLVVSVVLVDSFLVCEDCDADLLPSVMLFLSFEVAALVGRDCCWRRAAEARRSAIEVVREDGFEAILPFNHYWSVCT